MKVAINYQPPQCQHVESGRCGSCAYPTMARRTRYVESVKTDRGYLSAHESRLRERRRTNDGGKRHRKQLRAIRVAALMIEQPRRVSAYCRGI
jgi:hypothetical protein